MQSIRIVEGVTAEHSGDRVVILDAAGSAISTLNPTGATIWGLLEADMSLDDLAEATATIFSSVDRQQLVADIREFVEELCGLGLLSAED